MADTTRQRVLQAAAELDYVVNPNASRLAAGHNHTIGVVLPQVTGWYFQQVLAGAEAALSAEGYDMLLYSVSTPEARERFLTLLPFRKRVDGLLLVDLPLTDPEQRMMAGLSAKIVGVGVGGTHFPSVSVDNRHAAKLATRFLVDLGHRRIGLISGIQEDPMRFRASRDRREGWLDVLTAAGIEPQPTWEVTGDYRMQDGAECMSILLDTVPDLTAVVVMSDEMLIGAQSTLVERGLSVPADMSLVSFDGFEVTRYLGVTTVQQPMATMGRKAAELLISQIRGEGAATTMFRLPVSLVVRDTAAAPRGDRPSAPAHHARAHRATEPVAIRDSAG